MKQGRWVKLAAALVGPSTALRRGPWAVRVDGPATAGEPVSVARNNGPASVQYVSAVVRQATASWDPSIVLVAAMPPAEPMADEAATATTGPLSRAAPTPRRNLRECEACGERCSPGAGKCAACRAPGVDAAPSCDTACPGGQHGIGARPGRQ